MVEQEDTFYDQGNITVSKTRVVFGRTSYSVSNITSVAKSENRGGSISLWASAMIGLGTLCSLGTLFSTWAGGGFEGVSWELVLAGAFIAIVGYFMLKGNKPRYSVSISTASGKTNAYTSYDEDKIDGIINAINKAFDS